MPDDTPKKHATVIRDGYEVPLIGIPPNAVQETCDRCGGHFPMREVQFTGTQNLCPKCSNVADIRQRLEKCNARARAFKELPPILHDGDLDKFERLKTERLNEEIAILTEAMDVMRDMDALLSANDQAQRRRE